MTLIAFPLDTGPESAAITQGNTGAAVINMGTGGTGTYLAAAKAYGTYGVRLAPAAGQSAAFRFAFNASDNQVSTRFASTCLKEAASATSAAPNFVTWRFATGTVCSLRYLKATGQIQFVDGSAGTVLANFTPASLSTMYHYAVIVNNSTGAWSIKVYNSDDTTVAYSSSGTATFTNTGVFTHFQFGGGLDIAATQDVDYLQLNDGSNTEIAAPTGNIPPTVSLTANQTVTAGSSVSATATASDSDGSIASYAWTVDYPTVSPPALSGATTTTASFTAPAAGSLVILRCTVTDNGGATAFATTEVRVPVTTNSVSLLDSLSTGDTWSIIGGSSSLEAALSDANGATLVESPDISATSSARRFRFAPMATRSDLSITLYGVILTAAATTACVARVYSGATQITQANLSATTSSQDVTLSLTAGEIASITDWGNIWAEIVAVS